MNIVTTTDRALEKLSRSKRVMSITFVLAFLEQSFSPVLPEAYTALVLSYRKDISWKILSLVSACGSTLGALVTYGIGYFFYETYGKTIVGTLGWGNVFEKAQTLFDANVFWAQFFATLTPLPDRVFSFVAGAFGANIIIILVATFLGRFFRAWFVAYLAYEWGDEARDFIKKHAPLTIAVMIFFAVAYVVYKSGI